MYYSVFRCCSNHRLWSRQGTRGFALVGLPQSVLRGVIRPPNRHIEHCDVATRSVCLNSCNVLLCAILLTSLRGRRCIIVADKLTSPQTCPGSTTLPGCRQLARMPVSGWLERARLNQDIVCLSLAYAVRAAIRLYINANGDACLHACQWYASKNWHCGQQVCPHSQSSQHDRKRPAAPLHAATGDPCTLHTGSQHGPTSSTYSKSDVSFAALAICTHWSW